MEDELKVITTRLSQRIIDYVEKVAAEQYLDKAAVYRQLLSKAIAQDSLERAIDAFRQEKVTALKAAELADLPLTLFLDELGKRKIRYGIGLDEYREGLANLERKLAEPEDEN